MLIFRADRVGNRVELPIKKRQRLYDFWLVCEPLIPLKKNGTENPLRCQRVKT